MRKRKNIPTVDKSYCHIYQSPIFGSTIEIDFVEPKVCPFDCGYCPFGTTTRRIIDLIDGPEAEDVIRDLQRILPIAPLPEYLLLSGKGDPVIYKELGSLIEKIREVTKIPIAVITSGGVLWRQDVQHELAHVDAVLSILDSPDKMKYHQINRPLDVVPFDRYLNGLVQFSHVFHGNFWLHTTLVSNMNTIDSDIELLAREIDLIKCQRVFLRSVGYKEGKAIAPPLESAKLHEFAHRFGTDVVVREKPSQPKGGK